MKNKYEREIEWHFSTLLTTGTNIAAVGKGGEEERDRTENEFLCYYHVLELFLLSVFQFKRKSS